MTYRHIYTDPNPCACDSHDTEPTAGGDGRKCTACGTTRPDAFDPDRDPFNPEREGWTGWELEDRRDEDGVQSTHVTSRYVVATVWTDEETAFVIEEDDEAIPLYHGNVLPHRVVVSILIANGYDPEVGV